MGTPAVNPPKTLPANFNGWDAPPKTLPANFNGWDAPTQPKIPGLVGSLPGVPAAPTPQGLQGPQTPNYAGDALAVGHAIKNIGIGLSTIPAENLAGLDSAVSKIPYVGKALTTPLIGNGTSQQAIAQEQQAAQPHGLVQKLTQGVGNAAEFLIPGLGEETAAGKLASIAPRLGEAAAPLARLGVQAVGSGVVNKLQGGSAIAGAAAGGVGAGIGEGARALAPEIAESALGVTGANRMYGRTVGRAILDDTSGIKPSVIENSARGTIGTLAPQVQQIAEDASEAGSRGSVSPALDSVNKKIGTHIGNRAVNSAQELVPLRSFLQKDAVTGLPLADSQSPVGLLRLKRGLDSDFIGNWNPTRNTNNELDAAKSAYGNLADEFHSAAPGTKPLDQRISSLIPVADRANRTSLGASIPQNILSRFRTPTGALIGGLGGMEAGYHERGIPGAAAGFAAGAVLPSIIASPEAQMVFARTAAGVFPRLVVPSAVGGALQLKRGLNENPNK